MDVNEYMQNFRPARHESALRPFKADLLRLRALGYTLAQIQSFLAANNVMVSRSWIGEFVTNTRIEALRLQRLRDRDSPQAENQHMDKPT
jgi:DNA-binding transcriptional MerR regulator